MLDLEEVPKQVQQDAPPDPSDERFDRACKQFERACWRINDLSWAAFCSSDPAAARKALHKGAG